MKEVKQLIRFLLCWVGLPLAAMLAVYILVVFTFVIWIACDEDNGEYGRMYKELYKDFVIPYFRCMTFQACK